MKEQTSRVIVRRAALEGLAAQLRYLLAADGLDAEQARKALAAASMQADRLIEGARDYRAPRKR